MARLRLTITMSLDGYVAGPRQSAEEPLGVGGEALHEWVFAVRTFREMHGMEGGTTGPDDQVARESLENVGTTMMGRNMFGPVRGPWGDDPWRGWWGDEPPFRMPVVVLTHHPREPLEMRGGTTFHFAADGIEAALELAKELAGGKDVALGGGADVARQYLGAGLIDQMDLHVVPVLLGGGARLFADGGGQTALALDRVVASSEVVHYRYRRPVG